MPVLEDGRWSVTVPSDALVVFKLFDSTVGDRVRVSVNARGPLLIGTVVDLNAALDIWAAAPVIRERA